MKDPADIVNCRFAFKCNMTWPDLARVQGTEKVRYCTQCETAVHLCINERELEAHAAKGHCVAYVETLRRYAELGGPGSTFERVTLGFISPIVPVDDDLG
jgi:hypothetical protein